MTPCLGVCQPTQDPFPNPLEMKTGFFLSSRDLGSDYLPHKCFPQGDVVGKRDGLKYLLVNVSPPISASFWDGPEEDYSQIILSFAKGHSMRDIGLNIVMADIVICPTYNGGVLDETKCSKIGTGTLHHTYNDALMSAPTAK